ncbi:MAG: hypothetical protein IPJ81_06995 [Chitinophagaceae bacterium]|nr:hypothetical protein [Chitinophagaceae bacterium]
MKLLWWSTQTKQFEKRMELKYFRNGKIEQNVALISKYKILRVKMKIANKLGFNDSDRYLIGTDKAENPIKYIYVVKSKMAVTEQDKDLGWQTKYNKHSWSMSFKTIVNELNLESRLPMWLRVEIFEDNDFTGFRLLLPEIENKSNIVSLPKDK